MRPCWGRGGRGRDMRQIDGYLMFYAQAESVIHAIIPSLHTIAYQEK